MNKPSRVPSFFKKNVSFFKGGAQAREREEDEIILSSKPKGDILSEDVTIEAIEASQAPPARPVHKAGHPNVRNRQLHWNHTESAIPNSEWPYNVPIVCSKEARRA